MDSSNPAVFFRRGDYLINSTVSIGSGITHVFGMQATLLTCGIRFADGLAPVAALEIIDTHPIGENEDNTIWIEDLNFFQYTDSSRYCGYRAPAGSIAFSHRTKRALVLRHVSFGGVGFLNIQAASILATSPGIGPLFVEDSYGGKIIIGGGVNAWARQLNPEPRTTLGDAHVEVAGGSTLWILGLKIEQPGPVIRAVDSMVELFGGFLYPLENCSIAFELRDSEASLSFVVESWHPWDQTQYGVQVNESHGCSNHGPRSALSCAWTEALWTYGAHGYPRPIGPTAETRNVYGSTVVLFRSTGGVV